MNKLKCVEAILAATATTQESVMQESKMKKMIKPFELFETPHKENKMKLKYLSLVLVIATAIDLPNTTVYTPWSAGTRANTCTALAAVAGLTNAAKANRKAKAAAKAEKAIAVKAALAAEHRAQHTRGKEIATWLENRKVCTAPAASRSVRKARSIRAKAKAIANRAVAVADYVNPNEGNIPSWVKAPIGMIIPMPASAKGKASVRRMARWAKSPWGRAIAEAKAKREEARAHRRAVRAARIAEDRAIRLSREEARSAKAAAKAAAKLAPKKGNAKRAYMARTTLPTTSSAATSITITHKVNGKVERKTKLTLVEMVDYLTTQGYKPAAGITAPLQVSADALPTFAIAKAEKAKASTIMAIRADGTAKVMTLAEIQALVATGRDCLSGGLTRAEREAEKAKRDAEISARKAASAAWAEKKAKLKATTAVKSTMGYKMATVTQEGTK